MYSEVLCKCERAGENAINYNERKILPPHKMQGRGSCCCPGASTPLSAPLCHHFPIPVIILVSATSSHHPWPSCSLFPPNEQLLVTVVGGPVVVVVVVVMAVLILTFP